MARIRLQPILLLAALAAGCNVWGEQLARAEQHYQGARYEAALANLEDMETPAAGLSGGDRARYYYVRGMTHWRLEQRQDARHWLALAREEVRTTPGSLTEEANRTIDRILVETDPLAPRSGSSTTGADAGAPASGGGSENAAQTGTSSGS